MKNDLNMYVMKVTGRFNNIHGKNDIIFKNATLDEILSDIFKSLYITYDDLEDRASTYCDTVYSDSKCDIKVENYTKTKGKSLEKYYNLEDITYKHE